MVNYKSLWEILKTKVGQDVINIMQGLEKHTEVNKDNFWTAFKSESVYVACNTKEQADDFVNMCFENDIKWAYGNSKDSYYESFEKTIYYVCHLGSLYYTHYKEFNEMDKVNYSDIFLLEA